MEFARQAQGTAQIVGDCPLNRGKGPAHELRNMNNARDKMQNTPQWSDTDTFQSQPLAQNLLKAPGVDGPNAPLKELLTGVRERFHVPRGESPCGSHE